MTARKDFLLFFVALVTQVVTYIHTTQLLLLFIPYKFLVRMVIKSRITKEKDKEEDTIKRSQQIKTFKFFSFNKSLCEKICFIFLSFVFKNMLIKVDFHCRLNFT